MGFTVAHQGGTKDGAYRAYVRLLSRQLLKRGAHLDEVPRVREEGAANAWLYVWDSKDEASAFAAELKKETRDAGWFVQAVRGQPSVGPLRPLEINVGRQSDGWTFGLEPLTWKAIQVKYPGSCRFRSVFVGSEGRGAFPAEQGDLQRLARMVLTILTWLEAEQLRAFGNFRVVDPVSGEELLPPTPIEPLNVG